MPTVLITGAGRGLGLEFVRQYAADGWRVVACCRNTSAANNLKALKEDFGARISVHTLDVDDPHSAPTLKVALQGEPIDVLINNAGIMGQSGARMGDIDYDAWADCLNTNVMGPLRVSEALVDNVAASEQKKLITISSRMGSITENQAPDSIVYRSSKAAVNMVMKCLANALGGRGVIVTCLHPGWVRTDMGGPSAAVAVEDSVEGMRKVIANLKRADNGTFRNYDGASFPW